MQRLELHCPDCEAPLRAEQVSLSQGLATCGACQGVFALDALERNPLPVQADKPKDLVVETQGGALVMRRAWRDWSILFMIVWCAIWDGVIFTMYGAALAGMLTGEMPSDEALGMMLFGLGHLAIGIGMTYWLLAKVVNSTTIEVRSGRLRVRHGPLWWPGSVELRTDDVVQLFVGLSSVRVNNQARYNLMARLQDGRTIKVLGLLAKASDARFIEQKLEERLGIQDEPVPIS